MEVVENSFATMPFHSWHGNGGPIWDFPLETCGQSRRGGSADSHVVRWSMTEEWRRIAGCIYFPLFFITVASIACIAAAFERHLQF